MSTAVISILHLAAVSDADAARAAEVARLLADALSVWTRVVVLGDLVELRERRADEAQLAQPTSLSSARPWATAS